MQYQVPFDPRLPITERLARLGFTHANAGSPNAYAHKVFDPDGNVVMTGTVNEVVPWMKALERRSMAAPDIDGVSWTIDRPYTHNRYYWTNGTWIFLIRDLGSASLWRLHARHLETGQEWVYAHDDHGNNQDGIDGQRALYGAAFRKAAGRVRAGEIWNLVRTPSLHDNLFKGLIS